MKQKRWKRFLTMMVCILLIMNMMPINVMAVQFDAEVEKEEDIVSEMTNDSVEFMEDNTTTENLENESGTIEEKTEAEIENSTQAEEVTESVVGTEIDSSEEIENVLESETEEITDSVEDIVDTETTTSTEDVTEEIDTIQTEQEEDLQEIPAVDTVAEGNINNPRIVRDETLASKKKATWDCVWFGSYPQSEVTSEDPVYSKLQAATDWENNEITIDGNRYRRMTQKEAGGGFPDEWDDARGEDEEEWWDEEEGEDEEGYYEYEWSDATSYHYFKYEPIKWRVLNISEGQAFLLADIALDARKDSEDYVDEYSTWEKSTLRSWLNAYGASENLSQKDYLDENFINVAFSMNQKVAIKISDVINHNNDEYRENDGGNNTKDKIFLLSDKEVCDTNKAVSYGFAKTAYLKDNSRQSKVSDYAMAMGVSTYYDYCTWWLRSPADYYDAMCYVYSEGSVRTFDDEEGMIVSGVRPALNLDLSYTNLYSYAGTVCSDGTKSEVTPPKCGDHVMKNTITKATLTKDGKIIKKCSNCGETETEIISYPKTIELSQTSYIYTGKVKKPTVKVTDANGQIIASSNYDVIYPSGRINVGTYKLTVKFKGDKYTGSTTKTFTINPGNQTLTGTKAYTKAVGNSRFYLDVKRTKGNGALSYKSSNTSVVSVNSAGRVTINGAGTAKITVTAAATKSYKKKTFTVTITVNPKSTTLSSVTSGNSANMTVKWAKNSAANGYEISYATKSDFSNAKTSLIANNKTTSKTIDNLVEGKKYYVRIRCYKTISGVNYYSAWSAARTVIILPKATKLSSVTSTARGKFKAKWEQNINATGYQIQYATKSNFSGAKTSSITNYSTTSKTVSNLTSGKKYYVRTRCYKTVGNTKYYSAWSSAKTVTISK